MKRLLVSTAVAATMAVSSTALAAAASANMNGAANGNVSATMPTNGNAGGNANTAGNANANAAANGDAIQTPKVISLSNWDYDQLYTKGWSAEDFIDHMKVVGQNGNKIGKVDDLVIAPDGRVLSAIIEVGGFWKINDTRAAVPWNKVKVQGNSIVTPVTKNNIAQYNYFTYSGLPGSKIAMNGNNNGGGGLFGGNDNNGAVTQNNLGNGQGGALGGGNNGQVINGNGQMNAGGGQKGNVNRQANNAGGAGMGNAQQARPWRVSELIGSYARLKGPNGNVNYGYVRDLIIRNGQVVATVVDAHNGVGARGYYAYPYYGYAGGWGWGWAAPYYNLPYNQRQVAQMPTFDYNQMKTQFNQS